MKVMPIKLKKYHFKIDTDKDGVHDWKDCMPFNPRYQDITRIKEGTTAFDVLEYLRYCTNNKARYKDIANYYGIKKGSSQSFDLVLKELVKAKLIKKPERGKYELASPGFVAYEASRKSLVWKKPKNIPEHDGVISPYMFAELSDIPPSVRPTKIIQKGTQKAKILEFIAQNSPIRYKIIDAAFGYNEMTITKILRVLEHSGLIYRPERGLYRITEKGHRALADVVMYGKWRAKQ